MRRHEEEEPEWFSGGPTSQSDTIELRGFEDARREQQQQRRNEEAEAAAEQRPRGGGDDQQRPERSDPAPPKEQPPRRASPRHAADAKGRRSPGQWLLWNTRLLHSGTRCRSPC